jgi:hypothetical protein
MLELRIRGYLPGVNGYPGSSDVTLNIRIAESTWRQQLAGLGRLLGVDMVIPFPGDDDPLREAVEHLREAQRQLSGNEIKSAMLHVRQALETVKNLSAWTLPGAKKEKGQVTANERWARIRMAIEDQASGAMHVDPGTKDYLYSKSEAEVLIAMTAALLRIVP